MQALRRDTHSARASGPAEFEIYTFVTDEQQYAQMRGSFEAAGLRPPSAAFFAMHDRRTPGGSDPYALIAEVGSRPHRSYVILVHQDVRLDQGAGADELVAALEQLNDVDPAWVVAGTAGGTSDLRLVRRLRDPHGGSTDDVLPARVVSLDENFLVFNPSHSPRCSPGLGGFHFYGTDVCLNALKDGGTAYVIDMPLTHLSAGRLGPDYDEARRRFLEAWQPRFRFTYVRTPNELLFLSRSIALRRVFDSQRMREWIWAWGRG